MFLSSSTEVCSGLDCHTPRHGPRRPPPGPRLPEPRDPRRENRRRRRRFPAARLGPDR